VTTKRWFLPKTPDLLGRLQAQISVTVEGLDAMSAWAHGDESQSQTLRECEHRADQQRRALREELTTAFTTPLEPEDLFQLSMGLDAVLNEAKDAVREAEVMALPPDGPTVEMVKLLRAGTGHLAEAFDHIGEPTRGQATAAADAAVKSQRQLERVYRRAMSSLLESDDLREVMARREMYRRLARIADQIVAVAERVWYAAVKES
jgi:uncharacterized protein Yka (UPF0111/DUF47 family)